MITLAIIFLKPPSGLKQPIRQQNSLDRAARVGCDQGAQQRHFVGGEVAPVVAALNGTVHFGFMNSRASPIVQGNQGARSPGGWPPFCAQASSHAPSQRRTSMPFIKSVPKTEYIAAVKSAPCSLFEPKHNRRPMARSWCSQTLLSMATSGLSTKTLFAMPEQQAQRLALARLVRQLDQFGFA
ncbi:MAG: hypothetical protein OXF26_13845 [Alphaproteobacteria bacterium]|nr:hypothetical protein [Alphaproteobacteria bacterium]MCY4231927.1 hypothetical protein [Alphaproteobacteria bacterium]MCY4318161.1 hypothetical protein [Alphaproteobacteria bacterium]